MQTPSILQVRGVKAFYGKMQALRGIDLDVHEGEIVALMGTNGAGKSTLMKTIFGLHHIHAGTIRFADQEISHLPPHAIARLGIAQVPEGRRIFPHMNVYENLQMGAVAQGFRNFSEDLGRVYSLFPRLKERTKQYAGTLSGGEQQMLAIARALISKPRLLLLDEPSLGVAPSIVQTLFDALRALNQKDGLSILLLEQNENITLALAQRGYVMIRGVIAAQNFR